MSRISFLLLAVAELKIPQVSDLVYHSCEVVPLRPLPGSINGQVFFRLCSLFSRVLICNEFALLSVVGQSLNYWFSGALTFVLPDPALCTDCIQSVLKCHTLSPIKIFSPATVYCWEKPSIPFNCLFSFPLSITVLKLSYFPHFTWTSFWNLNKFHLSAIWMLLQWKETAKGSLTICHSPKLS